MRWPNLWPRNGELVARAAIYAQRQGELKRFALTAMRMEFLEGLDLGGVDSLRAVAGRAGFSPEDVAAAAVDDPDIDAAMRACADEAIAVGVFGIPTVVVEGELFWGDDRLEEAAARAHESAPGAARDKTFTNSSS